MEENTQADPEVHSVEVGAKPAAEPEKPAFTSGTRVRVNAPGTVNHGKVGKVRCFRNGIYHLDLDASELEWNTAAPHELAPE